MVVHLALIHSSCTTLTTYQTLCSTTTAFGGPSNIALLSGFVYYPGGVTFPCSHYVCIAWHLEHLGYSMVMVVLDHHLCNVSALTTDTNGYPIQSHNTQAVSGEDTVHHVQRMHVFNLGLLVHIKSSSNIWPQVIPCLVPA